MNYHKYKFLNKIYNFMIYDDYFDVDSEFFIEYMKIIQEDRKSVV